MAQAAAQLEAKVSYLEVMVSHREILHLGPKDHREGYPKTLETRKTDQR